MMRGQILSALRQSRRGMQTVTGVLLLTVTWLLVAPTLLAAQPASALRLPPARTEAELVATLAALEATLARFRQQLARAQDAHGTHTELRTLHRRLQALDRQARQALTRTARQLRAQGLPAAIVARHQAMVINYQTKLSTLQRHLEALDASRDARHQADHAAQAQQHLQDQAPRRSPTRVEPAPLPFRVPAERVQPPQETHKDFDSSPGVRPPVLVAATEVLPGLVTAQAVPRPAPPSAADLAPTEEVQLTDEITALAASLGNNPVRIFNWVHDQITFLPTYGSLQGAALTLQSRQGNASDTASLLIALLRAAGIHARYGSGTVQIPIAQVLTWVGVATPEAALEVLGQGGVPSAALVQGGAVTAVKLEHVWVEAWIDFEPSRGAVHRQGDTWVPLDASFKPSTATAGQAPSALLQEDVHRVATALLGQVQASPEGVLRPAFDLGPLTTLWQETPVHLLGALPAATPLGSVLGQRTIVPSGRPALAASLPYTVLVRGSQQAALSPAQRHHVQMALFASPLDHREGRAALTATLSLPAVQTRRLGVTWTPATPADAALLERVRAQGTPDLPVYLLQMRPLLQLDGVTVAGGPPLPMGQRVAWDVTLVAPQDPAPVPATFWGRVGDEQVVSLNGSGLTPASVQARLARPEPRTAAEDLHLIALQYWLACDRVTTLTAQRQDTRVTRLPSVALAAQPLVVTSVFGMPYTGTYRGYTLDVGQSLLAIVAPDAATRRAVLLQTGMQASYLTGASFESTLGRPQGTSRSAVSLLAQAQQQGIPVAALTVDNVETLVPQLPVRPEVATALREAVAAGYLALVPVQPLPHGPTAGLGYAILDPRTGAGAYRLDDGVHGGALPACQARSSPALAPVLFPALTMVLADLGPAAPLAPGEPALAWLTAGVLTTTGVTALAPPPDTLLAPSRVLVALALVGHVWPQALVDLALVAEATAANCGAETTPPVVTLHGIPTSTAVGHPVFLTVTATGAHRIATLALWVNDQPQPLDTRGRTTYTPPTAGSYTVLAAAQDGAGNVGRAQATFVALDAAQDTAPPVVTLTPLNAEAPVTAPTVVRGTVEDATLVRWTLALSPRGAERWTTLATGTTAVPDGVLGTLDPTLLPNDLYEVRLIAEDVNGRVTTTTSVVQVSGGMKVGHLRFTLEDLSLPLLGLPITIERTYDSRDTSPGDFGAGWRLDLQTTKLRLGRPLGTDWTQEATHATFPRSFCLGLDPLRTVTITLPDGRQEVFDLVPTTAEGARHSPTFGKLPPQCQWLVPVEFATAVYQPRPGTLSTLEALADRELLVVGGPGEGVLLFSLATLDVYAPTRFRLTTPEGLVLELEEARGVEKLTDPNGHTLTFGPDGIRHSAGTSVAFTRDGQGRITRLADPLGHTLQYTYDAAGDLTSVTDQEGQTTRYTYDRTHKLLAITDPRGVTVAQTRYDAAGRVVAHIDAEGHRVDYTHDIAGRQEVVRDRLGHVTMYVYDERGNILRTTDPLGATTTSTYDGQGNLLAQTDPLGHTTTWTYDTQGNVLTVTDALGHTTTSTYNARRQLLSRTDALGHTTTYTYDANGNLLTETDALGHTTTYTYSQLRGLLIARTDALGQTRRFGYNTAGYVTQETDALGHITTYAYDASGNPVTQTTTRTDALGQKQLLTTTFIYDRKNRLIRTIAPEGMVTQTEYTVLDQPAATIDANGNRTTYQYDLRGARIAITYSDGTIETSNYDAEGRLLRTSDRVGRTTRYSYDARGRLLQTLFPDGTSTSAVYDAAGHFITSRDARGFNTTMTYDAAHRQTSVINALGQETTFSYDALGSRTSTTDAQGQTTTYTYDAQRRRIATTFADGTTVNTTYDAVGQLVSITDEAGHTTQMRYDALGRLEAVRDALSQETTFSYDEMGNRVTQTDANGHTTRWTYDALGRVRSRTLPLGMTEMFTYDAHGNVLTATDFLEQTTAYTYDTQHQLRERTLPDRTQIRYTYAPMGQRATVMDGRGVTTYQYDERDRLTTVIQPDGTTLASTYDAEGNRTAITTPTGTVRYTYDANQRLETVMDPHGGVTTYTYDAVGNRVRTVRPNRTRTDAIYDRRHRLTQLTHQQPDGQLLARYTYTLGPTGLRLRLAEANGRTVEYTYDTLGRLIQEQDAGLLTEQMTITHLYDAVGNRLAQTINGLPRQATYDANDRLRQDGSTTLTYDVNGHLTQRQEATGTTRYTYDAVQRLQTVTTPAHTVQYIYDAEGLRVGAIHDGMVTQFLVDTQYDVAQVLEERDGQGTVRAHYTYGASRLSQDRANNLAYYHADALDSTRLLTDASGAVLATYDYKAYGELLSMTGAHENPYRFAGEAYDPLVDVYYLRARYYQPGLGRFWSMDPFTGFAMRPMSLHKYLYAYNNPVNWSDPSGLYTLTQALATSSIVGAVSGGTLGGIANGWRGAAYGAASGAVLSPALTLAAVGGGYAIAPLLGVSTGTGIYLTGAAANIILGAAGVVSYMKAETDRERLAAGVGLVMFLATMGLGAKAYWSARAGRGTFRNLDPQAAPEEIAVGKWMANVLRADIARKTPEGPHGPGTADYRIDFQGKTLELKNLSGSKLNNVVSQINHAQGDFVAVILRPGQFSETDIARIPARIFSPNNPSRPKNRIMILFENGTGYELGYDFTRAQTP